MMRSRGQLQRLFRAAAIAATTLVVAAMVMLLLRKGQYDQLLAEYEASRAATALIEQYSDQGTISDIPAGVHSFALYDAAGRQLASVGDTSAALSRDLVNTAVEQGGQVVTRSGAVVRLVRILGVSRQPAMNSRGQRAVPGIARLVALLEYDLSGAFRQSRIENLVLGAVMVVVIGMMGIVVMLYRRLRLLEHERERNLRLAQLGQAARTLAHEIRNPLAAAQMQSALLRRTSPDSDTRRFDVIDEELGRIKQLTEQVRTYLQSSPGSPESIDLAQLVHEIAERSGYAAAIATSGQPVVRFDLERLRSVCANVIRNAAESTDPAGSVDVTIRERRDVVEMVVADRGPGIPPESRDRVFDPFYTTKDHGSGVGLAITRRYIEEMKGTISIRDRRGGGTEIVITFRKGDDARSGR